jgi:ubiquinone/menaquinone biosynthesis C-methylase UbiE
LHPQTTPRLRPSTAPALLCGGLEQIVRPLTDVRDISKLAYGFMATQALVAALDLDLFGVLRDGRATLQRLADRTAVRADRLEMLLTALVALGLLVKSGDAYANGPAAAKYLDPESPEFFGEYIRLQVGRQVYPHALHIGSALQGAPKNLYGAVAADPDEAARFSHSQHVGSLGPAHLLARQVALESPQALLDVAGGSGAFTIALCRKHRNLQATILDFPAVIDVARHYVAEAGLEDRVSYVRGDALEASWPPEQDVVLFSYLLSAVGKTDIEALVRRAHAALKPGGTLVVHDFMVDEDLTGPASAALWMLVLATSPEPVCLTAGYVSRVMHDAGLAVVAAADLVPTITKVVVGVKPEADSRG